MKSISTRASDVNFCLNSIGELLQTHNPQIVELGTLGAYRFTLRFAEHARSTEFRDVETTLGAFVALTRAFHAAAAKDHVLAVCLTNFEGVRRLKTEAREQYGIGLDDDGVMGRAAVHAALRTSPYFAIAHSTFKDGWTLDGERAFAPQERSRIYVVFARPLPAGLVRELIARNAYDQFARRIESMVGLKGTDDACLKDPMRLHYSPAVPTHEARVEYGIAHDREPWHRVYVGELIDPVPIAEQIIASLPEPAPRRELSVGAFEGRIPPHIAMTLKGVALASLIECQFDDLVARTNNLQPLILHRCPFADEHNSRRGQSDASLYVYDPNPDEGYLYPTMRCRHASCQHRKTEDFVSAMIDDGDLDFESVYLNPDCRDYFFDE